MVEGVSFKGDGEHGGRVHGGVCRGRRPCNKEHASSQMAESGSQMRVNLLDMNAMACLDACTAVSAVALTNLISIPPRFHTTGVCALPGSPKVS